VVITSAGAVTVPQERTSALAKAVIAERTEEAGENA